MLKYITSIIAISGLIFFLACQKRENIIPEIVTPNPLPEIETGKVLSEILLSSERKGNTYELINSVFAPGYNVVEAPDCSHESFGRHIDEVFDNELNKNVFRFHIHKTPDNDRCKNFDRQRNEIKTYDKSPDGLLGVKGEKVVYSWSFKLSGDFKSSSSFTHIHQLKAVGGEEESMPLITLTTRKGAPDRLELRYAERTSQTTLESTDLSHFKGQWVHVVETVIFGEKDNGAYKIEITDITNKKTLFSYSNTEIRMWKTNASFMRPKWGIYRSLNNASDLKDEQVLFADFKVQEIEN